MNKDIQVINLHRNYFERNKDQTKLITILKEDRERTLLLNTYHNIIEVSYFTGHYYSSRHNKTERIDLDWFGASYEILDALFEKYKTNKSALTKLATFCMNSKSKVYWIKLKTSPLAKEIMATVLGGQDEED